MNNEARALAKQFHEAYERLAPSFGYTTRAASCKPWDEVPEQNRNLMIAVCAEVMLPALQQLAIVRRDWANELEIRTVLQHEIHTLTQQLATAQARIAEFEAQLATVMQERDEAIRRSRYAVHEALLSAGHTKDEHMAAVFGQWRQAIQDALTAEQQLSTAQARVRELEEWKHIVTGAGTDQETVIRLAAMEYTKTAVQCWKDKVANLTAQLAAAQARVRELEVDNAKAHQIICDAYPLVTITPQDIAWAHERLAPPTEAT